MAIVSVILATYNEKRHITACLDALIHQDDLAGSAVEILIADGGSHDATRQILTEYQRQYTHIRWFDNPRRIPPAAWNICLRQARGDVILLMGAHTLVPPDFIAKNLRLLAVMPEAGCVGGRVETAAEGFVPQAIALAFTCPFAIGNAHYRYAQKAQFVETINYGAYRREVFDKVGEFNESLIRNDDWEFNYRARKAGFKFYFSPEIRSTYYPRTSITHLWKQQFWTSYGKIKVLQMYPDSFLWRHLIPFLFVTGLFGGGALAFVSVWVGLAWAGMLALYSGSALFFAAKYGHRHGWRYAAILPFIFLTIHLAYGLGFLSGLLMALRPTG